jgi:YfiH family protein
MAEAAGWEWARWSDHELGRRVAAVTTTRPGGVSKGEYASFNLASHVRDNPADVSRNRRDLLEALGLARVQWLEQVHGTAYVRATLSSCDRVPVADAAWTAVPGLALAVLTADCLPLVLAARDASAVAVIHAGWRGLVAGIIPRVAGALPVRTTGYVGWIGPGIGPAAYEVGGDVAEAVRRSAPEAESCLTPGGREGKHQLDLAGLAAQQLAAAGIAGVERSSACTWSDERFYSYRRDGATGRQATLVWIR